MNIKEFSEISPTLLSGNPSKFNDDIHYFIPPSQDDIGTHMHNNYVFLTMC